jgi:vacuolar-type H+-ATPase subunit H
MTKPGTIIDAQLDHLLEVVNNHRDERCDKIRSEAHQHAREIVRQAYRDARQRLHRDVQESRQQMQRSIASARAKQKTQARLHKQQEDLQFLDMAWRQLHDMLATRWRSSDTRESWVEKIFLQACQALLENSWQVEHPVEWPDSEKSRLSEQIREHTGNPPDMRPADDISAGIRISSGGASVDGSISGLLADRLRIDSELLSQGRT